MKNIYLDYAAATPLDQRVQRAMQPYFSEEFYNPSAIYLAGRRVRQDLETARSQVSTILGAKPPEIVFTAGATEANNLALQGVMRHFPAAELVVSAIEHDSILAPAGLFKGRLVAVNSQGITDPVKLKKIVSDKTVLVSVMLVNNETGAIQPLKEIAAYLRQVRIERKKKGLKLPIYLHTDAAQAPAYLDLHVSRLGIDFMSINGGKIYGPKQSGALYIKTGTLIDPLILGGGQESGLRSGTENTAGCIGLATALKICAQERAGEFARVQKLSQKFIVGLNSIPKVIVNSPLKHRSPHIINASFGETDNERLMMELDEAGVQVGLGSACSASDAEPSHVLRAMGLSRAAAGSSLRFSIGRPTKADDIDELIKLLTRFTASNR